MTDIIVPDLNEIMKLIPAPAPGEECYGCHRKVPTIKSDDERGPTRRSVVSISEPKGEEGTLETLMIGVIDKYQEQWPIENAAMRAGVGLNIVGGANWKYRAVHFGLYATLMVAGLEPTE